MKHTPSKRRSKKRPDRRGSILLLVLIVVAVLTLASFAQYNLMFSMYRSTTTFGQQVQAKHLCESGKEYVLRVLSQTDDEITDSGGLFNNPAVFHGILVRNDTDARYRGRFTVVAPAIQTDGTISGVRFGLEDESTRLNLNTLLVAEAQVEGAGRELLMTLPGMTEAIADAILDWIDEDDEPREFGAELEYYSGLQPAYAPTNGPLLTVEQLLQVRDVTPELLFGADLNRNGMIDPDEENHTVTIDADTLDGEMDRGWSAYLTVHSAERNLRPDGTPKIDVNMDDLEELHKLLTEALDEAQANFIVAYRQGGPFTGGGDAQQPDAVTIDFRQPARVPLVTILDLIGVKTRVVQSGQAQATIVGEAFPNDPIAMALYLPALMDNLSVNPDASIPGRININQASKTVLSGIPGLDEQMVDQILSIRDFEVTAEHPNRKYETWLLIESIVTLDEMKDLMRFVTAGGSVYRCQIVGFFDQEGASARAEALIDATQPEPNLLRWRDMSHLGRGYSLETLGAGLEE